VDQVYSEGRLPWIRYVHQISGALLSVFILLHLSNHLFALFGADMHNQVMQLFRKIYRFPPLEGLLLLAVLTQLLTGISLAFHKWKNQPIMVKLQVGSGLYLSLFLIYHLWAILMARFVWIVETDIHFANAGLQTRPSIYFFLPYYSLAVMATFVHIATIHYNKSRQALLFKKSNPPDLLRIKRQTGVILVSGLVVTTLIMLGLCGYRIFYDI
jgi:hypothetical protein